MNVAIGTEVYGRVKRVGKTPIVTTFGMAQLFPIAPEQSFYLIRLGRRESSGVPFLASVERQQVHGVPLAQLDKTSVVVAYARAVFAVLTVFGAIALLIFGILSTQPGRGDLFVHTAMAVTATVLATGVVGGLLTYLLLFTPRRERDIRRFCAELLGVAADPAKVPAAWADRLAAHAAASYPAGNSRLQLVRELIHTRVQVARAIEGHDHETATDDLLARLRQFPSLAGG